MPKANNKDVYYFSHDCNARNDDKILALRSVYGLEGYAMYFMLIEILREQPTYRYELTKYSYNALAMQMQCNVDTLEKLINDCCNEFTSNGTSLLNLEDGFLYSESLLRRMEIVDATSESRRIAAEKRWEKQSKCKSNANADQKQSSSNAIRREKNKVEESKEEDNINIVGASPDDILCDFFDSVWNLYPRKDGKSYIKKITKKELQKAGFETIKQCIDSYIKSVEQQRNNGFATLQYAMGSTFFNTRWKDYLPENNQESEVITDEHKRDNPFGNSF